MYSIYPIKKQISRLYKYEYISTQECANRVYVYLEEFILPRNGVCLSYRRNIELNELLIGELQRVNVENFDLHQFLHAVYTRMRHVEGTVTLGVIYRSFYILIDSAADACYTKFTRHVLYLIRRYVVGRSHYLKVLPVEFQQGANAVFKAPQPRWQRARVRSNIYTTTVPYPYTADFQPALLSARHYSGMPRDRRLEVLLYPENHNTVRPMKVPLSILDVWTNVVVQPRLAHLRALGAICYCGKMAFYQCRCKWMVYCCEECQLLDLQHHEMFCAATFVF